MSEVKVKARPKREVGRVYDARFHTAIMIGTKELTPNANAIDGGPEGYWLDVVADGVWAGYSNATGTSWSFVPWDTVRYIRYVRADGTLAGEQK